MEIVMMEKSDFDRLVRRIEDIAEHIRRSEFRKPPSNTGEWVSNKEAMELLGVSPRTLQRYRDNGCIPYSKIGKNCRYRLSDLERTLERFMINGTEDKPEGLHRQYLIRTRKTGAHTNKK